MKLIVIAVLLVFAAGCLSSFEPSVRSRASAGKHAALDTSVPSWLDEHDVPSAAVAYIENGEVAFTAVWGEQAPGIPATAQTLYNVASLTKPVVAETILRLVDEGRVSLDEPLGDRSERGVRPLAFWATLL